MKLYAIFITNKQSKHYSKDGFIGVFITRGRARQFKKALIKRYGHKHFCIIEFVKLKQKLKQKLKLKRSPYDQQVWFRNN